MTNIVRIKEGEYYPSKDFKEVKEVIQPKHELIQQKAISVSRMSNGKLRCSSMSKLLYKSGFEGGQYIDFKQIEKGLVVYASSRDTEHKIYSVVNKGRELGNLEIKGDLLEGFTVGKHTIQYFTNGKINIIKEGWRMRKLKLELLDSGAKAIIIIALVWLCAFVLLMLSLVI